MWISPRSGVPQNVHIAFSDNVVNFSLGKTSSEALSLQNELSKRLTADRVCLLRQIHSNYVVPADPTSVVEADAHWTAEPNLALVILTADCIPLILCNREGSLIAAVHCGWRGVAKGIVATVLSQLPVDPPDLLAFMGPAICGECYEIGEEILPQLQLKHHSRHLTPCLDAGKYLLDLPGLVHSQLTSSGVGHVELSDQCTFHDSDRYSSHRRTRTNQRQVSCVQIRNGTHTPKKVPSNLVI